MALSLQMSVCTKPEEEWIWFISWLCLFSIFIFYVNELSLLPFSLYPPEHPRPLPSGPSTVSLHKGNSSLTASGWFKVISCYLSGLAQQRFLTWWFGWFSFVKLETKSFFFSSMHNTGMTVCMLLVVCLRAIQIVALGCLYNHLDFFAYLCCFPCPALFYTLSINVYTCLHRKCMAVTLKNNSFEPRPFSLLPSVFMSVSSKSNQHVNLGVFVASLIFSYF